MQTIMTNPRDILTSDSKSVSLPSCAYPMFTHNTGLIMEDGFVRRSTGHEFTSKDRKTEKQAEEYKQFFIEHSHTFGSLGDFVILYYLEHPEILTNHWMMIGKLILREFLKYAGMPESEYPAWLDYTVESAMNQEGLDEMHLGSLFFVLSLHAQALREAEKRPTVFRQAREIVAIDLLRLGEAVRLHEACSQRVAHGD